VALGNAADMEQVLGFVRTAGPTMAAFNAWVFLKGIETLRLRMDAHCANAQALAQWLQQQAQVEQVFYAGLESHPGHKLAKQQQRGFGGVLSFKLAIVDQSAQRAGAWAFIDATEMVSLTANLGDVKTTIVHPATTTHSRLSDAEKQQAGISENLIRVAVGLEAIDDIIADLSKGFAALG
ncbi:MAG: PLP-dependent transferase, partial [Cellvibrionaceae bacterium]|nr:PLP-dependent transferase [Cellvibrionaceae bacterium]